jgi:hypothetical protein
MTTPHFTSIIITHGVFSIFAKGRGQMPLPRIKVVTFLIHRYKSVMSTIRQMNGANGCLMSSKKALSPYKGAVICQVAKERLGADPQTSGNTPGMSTNTFEMSQSLRSSGSRKRVYLI